MPSKGLPLYFGSKVHNRYTRHTEYRSSEVGRLHTTVPQANNVHRLEELRVENNVGAVQEMIAGWNSEAGSSQIG